MSTERDIDRGRADFDNLEEVTLFLTGYLRYPFGTKARAAAAEAMEV